VARAKVESDAARDWFLARKERPRGRRPAPSSSVYQTCRRHFDGGQYLAFLSRFQIAKVKLAGGPYFFWASGERQEERGVFYSPLDKWQTSGASRLDHHHAAGS
jgi:hypothetical protein